MTDHDEAKQSKKRKAIRNEEIPADKLTEDFLDGRSIIIVSNRGPAGVTTDNEGNLQSHRNSGGLVTALLGLAQHVHISWLAATTVSQNDGVEDVVHSEVQISDEGRTISLHLLPIKDDIYDGYYNVISNPLIWFVQHSMWDFITSPTITRETWNAWERGYVEANRQFSEALFQMIIATPGKKIVMLQDYHLYLVPRMLRDLLRRAHRLDSVTISHFVHIPWPGSEEFRMLPSTMRTQILDGLSAVDLLGFQTKKDCKNFLQSVESHLPRANVNFKTSRVWYRNRSATVRDFPISIDVKAIKELASSPEILEYHDWFSGLITDKKFILRVDRTDPSKNIVRGFQAFGEMLELHPEHREKVKFVAMLVPSRLDVQEYHNYHNEIMAAAGWVNSRYGTGEWEPIRVIQGENYLRALAALQLYDVLLVNSIADGMNLVSKEGPIINKKDGVLILSDLAGACQQLEPGALVISPCDVYATAEAMHQALTMTAEERAVNANRLKWLVEENDINVWFKSQIKEMSLLFR